MSCKECNAYCINAGRTDAKPCEHFIARPTRPYAKYFRITKRWFKKVLDYNELPSGKVYYSVDGKSYHPANREDFLDAQPKDFDLKVGNCYHKGTY